ncbi:MAG: hypothetical protein MUP81_01940 [Dehalococcoidia bacterium]|nr:hypothetical protein [Dehalococcoidia bacterium]
MRRTGTPSGDGRTIRRAGARPIGAGPEPTSSTPRKGAGSPGPGAFMVGSTFYRPGFKSGMVQPTRAQATALLASQGIYPAALYPASTWATGFPAGWENQLLSPTPLTSSALPSYYGGGGGYLSGGGNGGGFSLSSIPSWVWIGAAIFGGVYLLKGKGGKTATGKSMLPKNFKFKAKAK